jgi:hypothetical protein
MQVFFRPLQSETADYRLRHVLPDVIGGTGVKSMVPLRKICADIASDSDKNPTDFGYRLSSAIQATFVGHSGGTV